MQRQTTIIENSMIWCGAGISIAEILTGTYLAPLSFTKGIAVIILGHIIGCFLLFLAGIIGGQQRLSSMNAAKISFGQNGSKFFALLNVLQLIGWTGIMIYDGALAANGVWHLNQALWVILIGALIIGWLLVGVRHLYYLNLATISTLLILSGLLCAAIFTHHSTSSPTGTLSWAQGMELVIAMPLSWLPLISDYTSVAQRPVPTSGISAVVYGLTSCWMAFIGLGAAIAILTHDINIATIILRAGLGIAGLFIIIFSTITTTFMDAYSAGVSSKTIFSKWSGTMAAIGATILGTISALIFPMDNFSNFLYLIGSVFAPMIAIQITDYFILKVDYRKQNCQWANLILWLIGFIIYRILLNYSFPLGSTVTTIIIIIAITWGTQQVRNLVKVK
ncbi:Predicted hydroxymethylpyrimidine transporter CytX [Limosilactobacillus reuteri]|uniref:Predicted hydroxymethylpyrimidine transporter CytX n=1 Tax=Limosilactobacillus reuteri TaxID=1598 RepID=A0A0U5F8S2_LIMRT|nr:putative hydroxymethylpyrimidine transporter CytX [Limosilactobacillus reuteri]CUR40762.1 Predicted hydroxymethylpyrimidine transporter CytX [Limosilactobacillus reuteri]